MIVTICEHGRSFHSSGIIFIVFFSGLKVFTALVRFVLFVLGILFYSSRQLHRELFPWFISQHACYWCMKRLLSFVCLFCVLSHFWKCPRSFLRHALGFPILSYHLLMLTNVSICVSFVSFSCVISITKTWSTILIRVEKVETLALVLIVAEMLAG